MMLTPYSRSSSYINILQLFVFGDVVDPDSSVVQLVEDIVRTQVVEMVS